jgi:O-acetyl-ADP-ribose deacetylase (regulator of RNase III)
MIRYTKGNLLEAPSQALINTVNTMGVMGKGIALQFKEAFPENFKQYAQACKTKLLQPGQLLIVKENTLHGERIIVNFPTKTEWFQKSKYEYIESGLQALVLELQKGEIKSIAIPPLGCGNGGLQWDKVKQMIEKHLSSLKDTDILIYEPSEEVKVILKNQKSLNEAKLTPARAMLLYSMFHYETFGESSSLFVANKLAWFLQRTGENLKLKFNASHYGPYCVQVGHVLHVLNGKYLKGLEQMNIKAFEPIELKYETFNEIKNYIQKELKPEQLQRLNDLIQLIDGFQSALALEILATVDYVKKEKNLTNENDIIHAVQNWSNRKHNLFQEKHILIAIRHLGNYSTKLSLS